MKDFFKKIHRTVHNTSVPLTQKCGALGVLLLLVITVFSSDHGKYIGMQFELMLSAVLPGVVVDLTNEEREQENLNTLTRNPVLDMAARLKAQHMRDNNYFAHFSPEGISPWYWFEEVGYNYIHAGENLAVFFDDSDDVVQAWMDSPLHRDNILKREYTEIGLAAVEAEHKGYSTVFVVQLFGTPLTPLPETQPVAVQQSEQPATPQREVVAVVQQEEVETPMVEVAEVAEEDVPAQEVAQQEEKETVVEEVSIENKRIFVASHEATSTIPLTLGSSEGVAEEGKWTNSFQDSPPSGNTLTMLYIVTALLSIGLISTSITHATKHAHFTHAVYGIALLFVTTIAIFFHSYVVQANILL